MESDSLTYELEGLQAGIRFLKACMALLMVIIGVMVFYMQRLSRKRRDAMYRMEALAEELREIKNEAKDYLDRKIIRCGKGCGKSNWHRLGCARRCALEDGHQGRCSCGYHVCEDAVACQDSERETNSLVDFWKDRYQAIIRQLDAPR